MNQIIVVLALLGGDPYHDAVKACEKDGQDLVVTVGAEWCSPCVRLHKNVIPRLRAAGWFKRARFVHVDQDREPKVAAMLMATTKQSAIPVTFYYRRLKDRWGNWSFLVGYYEPEAFIRLRNAVYKE